MCEVCSLSGVAVHISMHSNISIPHIFSFPLNPSPPLLLSPATLMCFLAQHVTLHFLKFYLYGIVQHMLSTQFWDSPLCVPVAFPFYYWAVCCCRRDHSSFILFTCPPHDECVFNSGSPTGLFHFVLCSSDLPPPILSPASLSGTTGCSRVILSFPHRTLELATSLGSSALFCHFLRLSCLSPPD